MERIVFDLGGRPAAGQFRGLGLTGKGLVVESKTSLFASIERAMEKLKPVGGSTEVETAMEAKDVNQFNQMKASMGVVGTRYKREDWYFPNNIRKSTQDSVTTYVYKERMRIPMLTSFRIFCSTEKPLEGVGAEKPTFSRVKDTEEFDRPGLKITFAIVKEYRGDTESVRYEVEVEITAEITSESVDRMIKETNRLVSSVKNG
jgi:hypothetical protein